MSKIITARAKTEPVSGYFICATPVFIILKDQLFIGEHERIFYKVVYIC
jgi:hypothetical protein